MPRTVSILLYLTLLSLRNSFYAKENKNKWTNTAICLFKLSQGETALIKSALTLWRRISPNFRFERELQSKTILNWNTLLIVDISKHNFQPFIFKYIYGSDEWHLQFVKWREILDAESWTKTYKKTWACSKIFTTRMTKLCNNHW